METRTVSQAEASAPIISVKEWVLTILLMAIPLVNLIMLFVWAFGGGANPSKANYAKASLIWVLIGIVLYIIFGVIIFGSMMRSIT
jgi:hypothetical protein